MVVKELWRKSRGQRMKQHDVKDPGYQKNQGKHTEQKSPADTHVVDEEASPVFIHGALFAKLPKKKEKLQEGLSGTCGVSFIQAV